MSLTGTDAPDVTVDRVLGIVCSSLQEGWTWEEIAGEVGQALDADLVVLHECAVHGLTASGARSVETRFELLEEHADNGCGIVSFAPGARSAREGVLRPWGPSACVGIRLGDEVGSTTSLILVRVRWPERWSDAERALVARLADHLGRAYRVSRRIARAEAHAALGGGALDHLLYGVALLDANGVVLASNLAAQTALTGGDGICLRGAHLAAALPAGNDAIKAAVAAAKSGSSRSVSLLRAGGSPPLELSFAPLPPPAGSTRRAARVVAFICDPLCAIQVDQDALRALYGLSPAEARVLGALVRGESPSAVAAAFGVARETVRTHVKAILRKTGATNRTELVLRVLSGVGARVVDLKG